MPLSIKTGAVKVKDSEGDYVDIDLTLSDGYAPLESPAFTGTPTAPTPGVSDDSTKVATTAFVQDVVDSLDAGDIEYSSGATYSNGSTGKAISDLNGSVSDLSGAITSIENGIAIVVNGKRATTSATTGQFVLLVNSTISGKTDGMYTASKPIPANTDIDGTYLAAVTNGALNNTPNRLYTENKIFASSSVISYNTEIQLTDDYRNYNRLFFVMYNGSIGWQTRGVLEIASLDLVKAGTIAFPVYYGTTGGYIQLTRNASDYTKIGITAGTPSTLYITDIFGFL